MPVTEHSYVSPFYFTPSDENTWFYKATADVTNAFGAKQKGLTYECSVTGTTDAPQVVDFNVY